MKSFVFGLSLLILAGLIIGQVLPTQGTPPISPGAGGPGYLTYVSTDKPIYRTGEKVYVRAIVLQTDSHVPDATGTASYEIKGPKGDTITNGFSTISDSIVGFSWDIPTTQPGGEYTIRIAHPLTGDAPAIRRFDIRAYRAPRLKSQIVFVRDGYGPGDTVAANLHVDRSEGGVPAGARVEVSARVDGVEVWKGNTLVDSSGNSSTSFKLPASIARGEGTLAMAITDGGIVETASKTIPILLQTLDLEIYPEGGDLVAGLSNRVYVEGRTPAQKPADMAGVVVNGAGREVATFRTEHEGRGRFSFVPAAGETYALRLTEPAGIKTSFALPAVKNSGVVITSVGDISARQKDVSVRVESTSSGVYSVVLSQHGREVSYKSVTLSARQSSEIAFTVPRAVDGIIVATVYDDQKTPMAERLLFRQPERRLDIKVTPDQKSYVPGDRVTLRVTTTDAGGKPVGGLVGLTVTDSSVLELIDKREQTGRLPVMVLLENEVKNLADAHVYLDESNPKAPLATDLLLGTQGWRRFATEDSPKFLTAYSDDARRVLGNRTITDAERVLANNLQRQLVVRDGLVVAGAVVGGGQGPQQGQGQGQGQQQGQGQGQGRGGGAPGPCVGCVAGGRAAGAIVVAAPPPPPPPPPPMAVGAPPPPGGPPAALMKVEAAEQQRLNIGGQGGGAFRVGDVVGFGQGNGVGPGVSRNVVREYAHQLRPGWTEGSRSDFAETVYWNAGVRTDDTTGTATVSFNLSDSVTAFRVLADGITKNGALGSSISEVESVRPFYIEPKIPLQVTSGDHIRLPIGIVNGLNHELRGTQLNVRNAAGMTFTMPADVALNLNSKERARRLMEIDIHRDFNGSVDFALDAMAGPYRDAVTRKIDVQPTGFPFEVSSGGSLEANGSKSFEFTIPEQMVRGSLLSSVKIYPTPLASMTEALTALLQQPYGCFEQTSSTSYPIVMAQQYFQSHTGVDASIVEKTKALLETSYNRLTGFESPKKGYEWFGADPGHEALTAYGLMQFTDMAKVRAIDNDMVQRTRAWLLGRRDGNGGFNLNSKAVDSFGRAPADTTNAYIVWALTEAGEKGLDKEIAAVKASATTTQDAYITALGANVLHASGDRNTSLQLMDKLAKLQETNGSVRGAVTSITRSGGEGLSIESTSLALMAWLREPAYADNVERGIRWIVSTNKNGRFGSTQSTILALRAVVLYDAAHARPKAPGRLVLQLDGKAIGEPVRFSTDTQGSVTLPQIQGELGPGRHTLMLRMDDGSRMPFSMNVKYHSILPDSAPQTQIGIQVALRDRKVQEGGVTEAVVSINNKSENAIPTPVAIVGIPGGLEVRQDQLKELVKSGKIDAYEVNGREVVLYWRYIKARDKFDLPLSLTAAVPGTYSGPASRAYLYYTDEFKNWAPALAVEIIPK